MPRLKYSLFALAGLLLLCAALSVLGPKRVMAALGYTPVRDVDNPSRQPYVANFQFQTQSGGSFADQNLPAVPPGKRLVIQSLSGDVRGPRGVRARLVLAVPSSLFGAQHFEAPLSFVYETTSFDEFNAQQSLSGYAQAGDAPVVELDVFPHGDPVFASGTVTGYLTDLP